MKRLRFFHRSSSELTCSEDSVRLNYPHGFASPAESFLTCSACAQNNPEGGGHLSLQEPPSTHNGQLIGKHFSPPPSEIILTFILPAFLDDPCRMGPRYPCW